jgi:4,5:9,10-diseco-3-hydroxy-5,9,17-trioxoandrosta-1(10),2-diene-4-oate hydrolase
MSLPEGHYADVGDGNRMHYHLVGEGFPVLFLHGSGPGASGHSNFLASAEALAAHGFQCVLADSLGYGLSSKPTDAMYTLEFMGTAAVKLMDHLGASRFAMVGNSQGGAIAIRIALTHPDRVSQLVLMAPGGLEEREVFMNMRGIRSMLRCIYGPEGITLEGMQKVFEKQLFDASLLPPEVVASRTEIALTQPIEVFKNMRVDNQEHRLGDLGCPVLCFWGMDDLFCPPSGAHKVAERCVDAQVVLLTQCGHWVMVEKRDVFDRTTAAFLVAE